VIGCGAQSAIRIVVSLSLCVHSPDESPQNEQSTTTYIYCENTNNADRGERMKKSALMMCIALTSIGLFGGSATAAPGDDPSVKYWNIYDGPHGDSRHGIDIKQTFLSIRTPHYFVVTIHGYEFTRARLTAAEVFFDSNKKNPGPEYKFTQLFTADHDGHSGKWAAKMDTWRDVLHSVSCPKWRTTVNYASDVIRFEIPRRCLGDPAQVRWNVVTWNATTYHPDGGWYGYYDATWKWQAFIPGFWVARFA
jgi:hypothetical protein